VCLALLVLTSALRLPDDPHMSSQPIEYRWRGPVTDAEMVMAGCEWLHVDFGQDLAAFYSMRAASGLLQPG
jgi:hypothetical protein